MKTFISYDHADLWAMRQWVLQLGVTLNSNETFADTAAYREWRKIRGSIEERGRAFGEGYAAGKQESPK